MIEDRGVGRAHTELWGMSCLLLKGPLDERCGKKKLKGEESYFLLDLLHQRAEWKELVLGEQGKDQRTGRRWEDAHTVLLLQV